ncbi:unnamed protein product [Bursaphelenchus xylophilus]|uniref:(pine wood nematode) hypothetical protein n=1 Tax=Bursaphelenchus xylophilus TaxID=6326 RepID=A0A1I7S4C8_BURXY|nr:unnamed protein product [Bursaphelenchus xylophilus]CAG9116962.1 unnamed protein product [Bursaphelenchus xylophilus]
MVKTETAVHIGFTFSKPLKAPTPPQDLQIPTPPRPPPPVSPRTLPLASTPRDSGQRSTWSSCCNEVLNAPAMVCCCFCCPLYKCAFWLCCLELIVSVYCWYNIGGIILQTIHHFDLANAFLIFVLTFWIITLSTAFGMLIAAEKRKNASYVLPRLIQQIGLLTCGFVFGFLCIFYFTGGAEKINSWVFWFYRVFLDEELDKHAQKEVASELRFYGLLFILLDIFFIGYVAFGFCITRKYHKDMERQHGTGFAPVSQYEPANPSAPPPPPINPNYKA